MPHRDAEDILTGAADTDAVGGETRYRRRRSAGPAVARPADAAELDRSMRAIVNARTAGLPPIPRVVPVRKPRAMVEQTLPRRAVGAAVLRERADSLRDRVAESGAAPLLDALRNGGFTMKALDKLAPVSPADLSDEQLLALAREGLEAAATLPESEAAQLESRLRAIVKKFRPQLEALERANGTLDLGNLPRQVVEEFVSALIKFMKPRGLGALASLPLLSFFAPQDEAPPAGAPKPPEKKPERFSEKDVETLGKDTELVLPSGVVIGVAGARATKADIGDLVIPDGGENNFGTSKARTYFFIFRPEKNLEQQCSIEWIQFAKISYKIKRDGDQDFRGPLPTEPQSYVSNGETFKYGEWTLDNAGRKDSPEYRPIQGNGEGALVYIADTPHLPASQFSTWKTAVGDKAAVLLTYLFRTLLLCRKEEKVVEGWMWKWSFEILLNTAKPSIRYEYPSANVAVEFGPFSIVDGAPNLSYYRELVKNKFPNH